MSPQFRSSITALIGALFLVVHVTGHAIKMPMADMIDLQESECFPSACYGECPETHPELQMRALITFYCECCKD